MFVTGLLDCGFLCVCVCVCVMLGELAVRAARCEVDVNMTWVCKKVYNTSHAHASQRFTHCPP